MILKSLSIENIRSYEEQITIEFPLGTSLFEGDIGSGKSTILMAIEFALFGLGNQKGGSLLRSGAEEGSVLLEFDLDETNYKIERLLIRKEEEGPVRQDKCLLCVNGVLNYYSPTEMKEKILTILNFKEPPNPRAQSVIYRYAIYTPQEEMKEILAQRPEIRLQTLRKAFGVEDYKIAVENANLISRSLKDRINYLSGQTVDLRENKAELVNLKEKKENNQDYLLEITGQGKELEKEIKKQKESLKELKDVELNLKEIKAEVPHLKKQIDDKIGISLKYNDEIEIANQENQFELIPRIKKLEKTEIPNNTSEESLKNTITNLKNIAKNYNGLVANLTLLNENKENIENRLEEEKIKSLNDLEADEKLLISKIKDQNDLVISLQQQVDQITKKIYKIEAKKGDITERLEKLSDLDEICPICGSSLDDEHKKNLQIEREKEIRKLNSELQIIKEVKLKGNNELESAEIKLKTFQNDFENLKLIIDKISRLKEIEDKIDSTQVALKNLDSDLARIIKASIDFDEVDDYINYFENLLEKLREYKRSQKDLENIKSQFKKNIVKIKDNERLLTILDEEVEDLKEDLITAEKKSKSLDGVVKEIENLELVHENISKEYQVLNEKIISSKTLIQTLEDDIKKVSDEIDKKEELKKQLNRINDYKTWLNDYIIPTLNLIEKHVMNKRFKEFNANFQKWFNILIDDDSKTAILNEEFTPIIEQDEYAQEMNYLSGGEKTSVALSYRLALNNVVQSVSTGLKSNILILDEPTDGFSKEQLDKVREILYELNCPQIIIVSHEEELESFADNVFRVEKTDGISQVFEMK